MKQFDMGDNKVTHNLNGATFFVELPTKGAFYPEEHPFYNKEKIEVKMLTTKEEEILTNTSYIQNEVVIDKLLENIVLEPNFNPKEIFNADQLAILIATRIDAYDEEYPVLLDCEACGAKIDHTISLEKVLDNVKESTIEKTDHGTLIVELPKSKKTVEYKVLLPADIASIERSVDKMKKMDIKTNFLDEFYKRIIVSVDGSLDPQEKSSLIKNLKIKDSRYLTACYSKSLPDIDTTFTATCPSCQKEQEGGMPFQANFFFPEF